MWPAETQAFHIRIHRPHVGNGLWPEGQWPLVVFSHGNGGGRYDCYDPLLEEIARHGFIVASIESVLSAASEFRGEQILCASRWLTHTWSEKARLRGDVAFMGHSAGGEGALFAAARRQQLIDGPAPDGMDSLALKAVVSLAPPDNIVPQPIVDAVARPPILLLQGATDNDPTHAAIRHFDRLAANEEHPIGEAGRSLVWVYDLPHFAVGGFFSGLDCLPGSAKGVAVAAAYVSAFLRWRMNGESDLRKYFSGPLAGEEETSALPPEVLNENFWTDPEWKGEPRIFREYAPDQNMLFEERMVLDAFEDGNLSLSTAQGTVTESGAVVLNEGPAESILFGETDHKTGALRVDVTGSGEVRWEVPPGFRQQLSGASYLSFRAGNRLQVNPDPCQTDDEPISMAVRLTAGLDALQSTVEIPVQDHRIIALNAGNGPIECEWTTFMKTFRVPLAPLCAQGLDLTTLEFVTFEFPAGTSDTVLLDSLEFTRSPFDDPGECGPPLVCEE